MATPVTELFTGGLVTARHSAMLEPGELQRADDCIYREKDPAIWRAPGRTQYGTVISGSPVLGLGYFPFENRYTSKVIAYAGTTLYSLPVSDVTNNTATQLGGPAAITGTCADVGGHTNFTASNTAYPFLASAVGARISCALLNGTSFQVVVTAVADESGSTGHYSTVTLKKTDGTTVTSTFTTSTTTIAFQWGVRQAIDQDATARNNIFDYAQYGSSYFCWFGYGEPRKIEWVEPPLIAGVGTNPVLTHRPLGLAPVTEAITLATYAAAWRASLGTGYFWFLVTEINVTQRPSANNKEVDNEIESSYLAPGGTSNSPGVPVAVLVPDTSTAVRITLPAVKNIGGGGRIATHWGIYMCPTPTEDGSSAPSLSRFRRIKRVPITTFASGATVDIFETISQQTLYASGTSTHTSSTAWTNASAMVGAPDAVHNPFQSVQTDKYARGVSNSSVSAFGAVTPANKATFTISTAGAYATQEITGIQITLYGRANSEGSNQTHASMYVFPTNGAGKDGIARYAEFKNAGWTQTVTFGGQDDTWGVSWGTFSALGTFGVIVGIGQNDADMCTWLDAVKITLWGSSATIDVNGKPYRCVVYRDQIGTSVAEPAYGLPPSCSTGDFFQGMLVLNDLEDDTAIRYSLPGYPEYFPKPYVMRLNTAKRRDKVTKIISLGQILIVGLEHSIERVNYLPREINTDLDDGLSHEELASDHGIPGPLAAVKCNIPGSGTVLIYVSTAGMFMTDGITTRSLNLDLDWPNTVKLSALSSCVLRVYPKEKWIILYYCPSGASHDYNTRALVFHYSPEKMKSGGFFPCTGPITVSGRASTEVVLGGSYCVLTGHETTGLIYKEDSGVAQAASYQVHNSAGTLADAKIQPFIRTRKIYPGGFDRDTFGEKVYILYSAYGSNSVTASGTTVAANTTVSGSAGAFNSVVAGMRVLGTGIDPGTIVLTATGTELTLSRAANASGTVTLTFDTGTFSIRVRGSNLGEAVKGLSIDYLSTLVGDLVSVIRSNIRRGFELQIEKVPLTFDGNGDTSTSADLSTNMRLHSFTYMVNDGGPDTNRNAA